MSEFDVTPMFLAFGMPSKRLSNLPYEAKQLLMAATARIAFVVKPHKRTQRNVQFWYICTARDGYGIACDTYRPQKDLPIRSRLA